MKNAHGVEPTRYIKFSYRNNNIYCSSDHGPTFCEDINIGDEVLTIDGSIQKIENTIRYKVNKDLVTINNEVTSTNDHKFFVINKEDKDKVNEENLLKYGYWIEAKNLNKNTHLLVKRY